MKLVKINDVRVGQIRKNFEDIIMIDARMPNEFYHYRAYNEFGGLMNTDVKSNHKFLDMPIIGKLGITHRIEDNRIVEIPREEFQVDDVVIELEVDDEDPFILISYNFNKEFSSGIGASNVYFPTKRKLQKIGIYGVTHEFVNNCEVNND